MLQKYSTWKVLEVFFDEPTKEHYLKEISRKANLSHTSVKKHLQVLKKWEIIQEREKRRGERRYPIYRAEIENEEYKFYKKIDLLHRLEFTNFLEHLKETYFPDCIVLFGSASRGEDIEESDIDLFLQAEEKEINLSKFEEKLKRNIQLHFKTDFSKYPKELKNNIANGIIIYGFLEVFK